VQPPFPGMDPYLEQPSLWPDVHASIISAIRDQIQSRIVPRYVAVITPYIAFESIEIAPVRLAIPDVGIYERDQPGATNTAVALAPAPLVVKAEMEIPTRYARIELRTVGDETLVTAIEVLSPANKRPGVDGADAYEKKRQELFRSEAHLLEIDLLRAGQRPRLTKALPNAPYFIFLSRAERRPSIEIWPLSLQAAIPLVPVPLRYPDPDIPLDLSKVLHQIYTNARYDVQVDYRNAPPAPDLAPDDATWLTAQLNERGLRS
jgi:hypothetical protein